MTDASSSLSASRSLTPDESAALRTQLEPLLTRILGDDDDDDDDQVSDLIHYTVTMVSNSKTIAYILEELEGIVPDLSDAHRAELTAVLTSILPPPPPRKPTEDAPPTTSRILSLQGAPTNALAMAGALGSARERKTPKGNTAARGEEGDRPGRAGQDRSDHAAARGKAGRGRGRAGRGIERTGPADGRGGRGGRGSVGMDPRARDRRGSVDQDQRGRDRDAIRSDADRRHGRGNGRDQRDLRQQGSDRRQPFSPDRGPRGRGGDRPGRLHAEDRRQDGRDNVHKDDGRPFHPDRRESHGDRGRGRGHPEDGRGGLARGGGRGRGLEDTHRGALTRRRERQEMEADQYRNRDNDAPHNYELGNKRIRRDETHHEVPSGEGQDGRGSSNPQTGFRGGRGGRGFGRGNVAAVLKSYTWTKNSAGSAGPTEGATDVAATVAATHPSPLVQANVVHGRGRGRGRGFAGGRFGNVQEILASKTWVRKKDNADAATTPSTADNSSGAQS